MRIKIFHANREGLMQAVALVRIPDGMSVDDALERAYAATQNIEGCWSQGEQIESLFHKGEMMDNPDYSPAVTVLAPNRERDGRKFGHRSTDVGDLMIVEPDGQVWSVDSFGFNRKEVLEAA